MDLINSLLTNRLGLFIFLGLAVNTLQAQSEEVRPVTEHFLIKNATVIPMPGRELTTIDVLVEKGIIKRIGQDLPVMGGARVIQADSLFIYAGFIEGISHTGIPNRSKSGRNSTRNGDAERAKVKDPGNPPNELAGIQPDVQARNKLVATDNSIAEMRKLGFTAAHTVPRGNMLPGSGAVILLHGSSGDQMTLKDGVSMYSQLKPVRGVYPATILGVIAKWRDLYRQAEISQNYEQRYSESSVGLPRPERDKVTEAFYPVVDGRLPVFFKSSSAMEIQRALALQEELGFSLVLADVKQSAPIAEKLQNRDAGILVSLDLPKEEKEEKKRSERGSQKSEVADSSKESAKVDSKRTQTDNPDKLDPEVSMLMARKRKAMKSYERQAAILDSLGISFGFSTLGIRSRDFRNALDRMIEAGLSKDAALRALTVSPARILGVEQVMGTVEEGKLANLVITTKPYFEKGTQVAYVFVDGNLYEYEIQEKGKGSESGDGDPVDFTGVWDYSVKVPGESADGVLTIMMQNGELEGEMTNSQFEASRAVNRIMVEGKKISFKMELDIEGQETELEYQLTVDGDYFEGEVLAGPFGNFPVEGNRIKSPENNN